MTDTARLQPISRTGPRLADWLRRLFGGRARTAAEPRLDPTAWSARMLRDIGLDEREIGRLTYPSRAPFDWPAR
jgi:hypothetical protein